MRRKTRSFPISHINKASQMRAMVREGITQSMTCWEKFRRCFAIARASKITLYQRSSTSTSHERVSQLLFSAVPYTPEDDNWFFFMKLKKKTGIAEGCSGVCCYFGLFKK
ncbi:hypothetical protein NPIL_330331 [Nephila pilipes]|uniref:Uncharacterized protein n=1 Tax=Nephila pilipes TaxID=299642 RepID=A0A8X6QE83_NEPPI|nr:hypothetical protein NPIL_330331 [Nephila pilipes]